MTTVNTKPNTKLFSACECVVSLCPVMATLLGTRQIEIETIHLEDIVTMPDLKLTLRQRVHLAIATFTGNIIVLYIPLLGIHYYTPRFLACADKLLMCAIQSENTDTCKCCCISCAGAYRCVKYVSSGVVYCKMVCI